jgi:hypothetical protein
VAKGFVGWLPFIVPDGFVGWLPFIVPDGFVGWLPFIVPNGFVGWLPFGIPVPLGAGASFVPGCALGAPFVMPLVGSPAGIMLGAAVELGAAVDDDDGALVAVPELEGAGWLVDAGAPELVEAGAFPPELAPEPLPPGALVGTSPADPDAVGAEPHATRACIVAAAETT